MKAWLRKKADPKEKLHTTLFKLACMAKEAGMDEGQVTLMCKAYASGNMIRRAPEREIASAVRGAFRGEVFRGPRFPKPMAELIAEVDAYPALVPYPVHGEKPPEFFLAEMFPGDPLLCVGATAYAMDTRPLSQWNGMLRSMQFVVPSPMVAETGPRKEDGRESFHAESNTGPRRFLVTEFDGPGKPQQMARIRALEAMAGLKLCCVVDSAGKSLHAYWRACGEEMDRQFFSKACQLGADDRLWLRSQFARIPGGTRDGRRQEIILWQY